MGLLTLGFKDDPVVAITTWGLLIVFSALYYTSSRKIHPDEPTVIAPAVPFIGHLLGMALEGGRYTKLIGQNHGKEPIFTLPVPGSRIYIVTDPALASLVQRNTKALSFTPLIPDVTKRVLGIRDREVEITRQNLDPEPGDPRGFLADTHDAVYSILGPGQQMTELSHSALDDFHRRLCVMKANLRTKGSQPVNLLEWARHLVTLGTTSYVFGPHDPFRGDPSLKAAFWDFDEGIGGLLLGIFPSITARKAYGGREKMVAALKTYFAEGGHHEGSSLVHCREAVDQKYGMSLDFTARSALSFLFAAIINATTITFWMVLRLSSEPSLVEKSRSEIEDAFAASEASYGPDKLSIEITKSSCHTIANVFREVLRTGSENFSSRLVKADLMLADKYFLKKGSVVQISGGIMHSDKSIWGDDVDLFNPDRFEEGKERASNVHPAAFRGFGGGKTLCPGRHFATTEVIVLVAMIVYAFDFSGPDGELVQVPPKNDRVLPVHILEPRAEDCPKVLITPRETATKDLSAVALVH